MEMVLHQPKSRECLVARGCLVLSYTCSLRGQHVVGAMIMSWAALLVSRACVSMAASRLLSLLSYVS